MNFLRKLISGNELQRTRFHDQKGHLLDLAGFCYLPHSIYSTALRLCFGHRPVLPWIGYRAIRHIATIMRSDWKVLEFGSGMSTVWLAQRSAFVVSVEVDPVWYGKVLKALGERGVANVDCLLRPADAYHCIPDDKYYDGYFDFALVDAYNRTSCMQTALKKVRAGGWIYLDNSDRIEGFPAGTQDVRNAERMLLEHQRNINNEPIYFRDLFPTYISVGEGLLGKV